MSPTSEFDDDSRPGLQPRTGLSILKTSDYVTGICLLLMVVVLWTSSNYLTQYMFTEGYQKPFLITYTNTSSFVVYLIPFYLRRLQRDSNGVDYRPLAQDPSSGNVPQLSFNEKSHLTFEETVRLALRFCFIWFAANWAINAALAYTSVASATVLSSMSGIFTLAVGRIFRVETVTLVKIGAVLMSIGGVTLISVSDSSQDPGPRLMAHAFHLFPIIGDILALLSSFFYAVYLIYLKVQIKDESRIDMQLFFGFVGLFNILLCWPGALLLHLIGIEHFELPSTRQAVVAILINMFITFSSDYIYVIAMLKTTPLVVTIGISLTIPLAVICDFLLGKAVTGEVVIGALLILVGFIVVGTENSKEGTSHHLIETEEGLQAQL
ncbi:hypothetical protein V8B97DRAFT_1985568, partial [Scleroderma yunnanense]